MLRVPLFLSDVSGSEVFLILIVILIFFGSKSIPGIARTMGRAMRQIKDASQEVQNEIRKSGADMKSDLNLKGIVRDATETIEKPFREGAEAIGPLDQSFNSDPRIQPPRQFVEPSMPQPMDQTMDQPQDESETLNK